MNIDLAVNYIKTIVLRTLPVGFSKSQNHRLTESLSFGPNPCWCKELHHLLSWQ